MKKVIINESQKDRILSEVSHKAVDKALSTSYYMWDEMYYAFQDFYDTVKHHYSRDNVYVQKIRELSDQIDGILERKKSQGSKFSSELSKFEPRKFYDDMSREEDDYDDVNLRDLQARYPKG